MKSQHMLRTGADTMNSLRMDRRRWLRLMAGASGGMALAWHVTSIPSVAATELSPATRAPAASASASGSLLAQGDGILRSADPFGAPSLDPVNAVTTYIIQYGLGEALVRITRQGTVEPWLAESVTPIDPLRWRV